MKKILASLLIILFLVSSAVDGAMTPDTGGSGGGTTPPPPGGGEFGIGDLRSLIEYIAVGAAVLMIVIGGFEWMTSAGDPSKIGSAKEKIYSAILGLVIIGLAETIAYLVGGQ